MSNYMVSELSNTVNVVLYNPIQHTQRIKYTSYDVSQHFIVLGANSGGLYIFHRYPCSFIKLIPNTEGSINGVSISPDEKTIAIGTSKGSICLVDNNSNNLRGVQVYNEHHGNTVTAMVWNKTSSELFIGDSVGKISVVIPQSFITKTMFQIPCSTVMQLDSNIVQLNMCSQFLLVSSLTRCYLCDTEKEQYRQIGQKLRDGDFGACFYGSQNATIKSNEKLTALRAFRILGDKENFMNYDGVDNLKIFCARPGSRIWEVKFDTTVIRTHQFKQALSVDPSDVLSLTDDCDVRYNFNRSTNSVKGKSVNFKKLFLLDNNFIITYKKDGLYIFDPVNSTVIFWTDYYKDIQEIKVVRNYIYLWTSQKFHVLSFSNLEDVLAKCILSHKYLLCADLCVLYQQDILKQVMSSRKLHLLSTLGDKLKEKGQDDLFEKLEHLLHKIKEYTDERQCAQKLNSGIYVVDNAHFMHNTLVDDIVLTKTQKITDNVVKSAQDYANKDIFEVMCEQYEMERINKLCSSKPVTEILDHHSNFDEITDIFMDFLQKTAGTDQKKWCLETYLKYLNTKDYNAIIRGGNSQTCTFIKTSFSTLNSYANKTCECGYPVSSTLQPQHYEIGCCILENVDSKEEFCKEVPYMWKHYLKLLRGSNVTTLLPLIVQICDADVLNEYINKFTYDTWNDALKLFVSLMNGNCLSCENKLPMQPDDDMWHVFADQMMKSIGPESTINLLLEHAHEIPSSVFDIKFYQSAIFSCVVGNYKTSLRKDAVDLVNRIHESECNVMFGNLLEKHLLNPDSSSVQYYDNKSDVCVYCNMPAQSTPILAKEKYVTLNCGHVIHNICLRFNEDLCNICNNKVLIV